MKLRVFAFGFMLLCFCLFAVQSRAQQVGLHDMVDVNVTGAPGTGTFTLGAAIPPYLGFAAVATSGEVVSYAAQDGAGNWERGRGTWTSGGVGGTLTRGVKSSSNGNNLISFGSGVTVYNAALAEDMVSTTYPSSVLTQVATPICPLTDAATILSDAKVCLTDSTRGPAVQHVVLTGAGHTLALPTNLPVTGGMSILYHITHSGSSDGPILGTGFKYPGGSQPPECNGTTITQNCWSTGAQDDYLPCISTWNSPPLLACGPVITNIATVSASLFTFVNANSCASASGPTCTVPSTSMTGADLLTVCLTWQTFSGDISGVPTDSSSNVYTVGATVLNASASTKTACYYKQAPVVTGSMTFTASFTGNTFPTIAALGFSGSVSSPLDQTNSNSLGASQTTSIQPGSITPTQNNELIIAAFGMDQNPSGSPFNVDSGYTLEGTQNFVSGTHVGGGAGYLIQTTAAATNPTFSWNGANTTQAVIMSFK